MYLIIHFLIFIILLFFFKFFSFKLKLVDSPNFRKKHEGVIPLIGGLVIYFNILISSFYFETSSYMSTILYTSIILIILGALDDAIELGVIYRLLAQLVCCLIVIGSGLVINNIGNYMFFPSIDVSFFSVLFTVFCVMGLTNSFNFIDGNDGLCSTLSLISILSIIFLSYLNNSMIFFVDLNFLLSFCFTLSLFIFFNVTNFSKIFLGDAGSMFLGFFVAFLLIITSQGQNQIIHPVLTIWCVTLPVFDITSVIIRRILRRINPFKPDRRHVHHILLQLGFSNISTTLIIITISVVLNCFGIIIFYLSGPFPTLVSFVLLLFTYVIFMIRLSRVANSN
jgi:UDP-GlcNAc:undecaprenyl-phosphate/decaprenyl-phosphate GlcNAc-1-phosphate transferase